ncbi:hypothetical protein FQA39_LY02936 [Lamprigera yunnana]|nr:hypothetical protein FQA39_LY02936 [Lamprigera yunnana]
MLDEEVKTILTKYQKQENVINESLQQNTTSAKSNWDKGGESKEKFPALESVLKRNKALLKDLETAKGTLRSKAIYSPSEMQWDAIFKQYQAAPALQVTSWKCHMATYV